MKKRNYGKGICIICGKEFQMNAPNHTCCSRDCGKLKYNEKSRESYWNDRQIPDKKPKEKHKSRFNEISAEAKACGMSYGKLQAKRYMESMGH